jgi:hypothetical protein
MSELALHFCIPNPELTAVGLKRKIGDRIMITPRMQLQAKAGVVFSEITHWWVATKSRALNSALLSGEWQLKPMTNPIPQSPGLSAPNTEGLL